MARNLSVYMELIRYSLRCTNIYCSFLLQNTYTNADKLLAAAEELAHTGECDPDEIYSVAHELEAHVTSFAARVDQRRRRLELAVLFYTHEKELSNWVDELRQELQVSCHIILVLIWSND